MDGLSASGDYGAVLRAARHARGLTQSQAGRLAGYSAATISRFETGARRMSDIGTLRRLADTLDIPPELFGLAPGIPASGAASPPGAPPLATVVTGRPQDGEQVRRRELLAGLTGLTGALLLPVPMTPGGPGPDPIAANLEQILAGSRAVAPVSVPYLRQGLTSAWRAFEGCRYQILAGQLPGLVGAATASRDDAHGQARQACNTILASAYVLTSELALKAHQDAIAWVAADRALSPARDSADPAAIAAASRAVAMAMRRQGRYDGATSILTGTALALGADRGNPPPRVLAAYGSLLCTAAYACAQNGQKSRACDLIAEAQAAATRLGTVRAEHNVFSTANVEVYQIGIHTALGDPAGALAHARAVDQHALPTAERHARFCIDTARAWQQYGRPDQACKALLVAERHSPEEIQRPSVSTLITTMTQAPGKQLPGLHQLAKRAGTRV